jgi:hypothetical protein
LTRSKNKNKITEAELETLDQKIILNKETTALQAKRELNIKGSNRSEKNYSNSSDQLITTWINMRKLTNEDFNYSIFIDECKNGQFQWNRSGIASETRSGLKPKYKHEASIHVLGGIFRKHKLMMFSGKLNTAGFKELAREFIIPFFNDRYPEYHRLHLDNHSQQSGSMVCCK